MESKVNSIVNNEYFIPLKPNHALALTMNFPQFAEPIPNIEEFDYNCPDCMADLFAPIMSPYRVLQQQSNDYRLLIEHLADRRYTSKRTHLSDTFKKAFARKWNRTFTHPLKYDIGPFLPQIATMGRYMTMIASGPIFIIGVGLAIFAIYLIFISERRQLMLTFIRTTSKFYDTFYFQGIIGYLILYGILLICASLCSSIAAFLCASILILFGICNTLTALALAIVLLIVSNIFKQTLIDELEKYMFKSIKAYDDQPENPVTMFWDGLQQKYSCCGLGNPVSDYSNSSFQISTGQLVPESCCRNGTLCTTGPTSTNSFQDESCLPQAKHFIDFTILITSIGNVVLIILLLVVLINIVIFFLHIDSAEQALNRNNKFLVKAMLSILEKYEKEFDDYKNSLPNELKFRYQQYTRGTLPRNLTANPVENSRRNESS